MTTQGIIYKLTCIINGKYYIGQTIKTLEYRWGKHVYNALNFANQCKLIEAAIRKYGPENFTREIILYCEPEKLDHYEILMIRGFQSTNRDFGYNILEGGQGFNGREITEESRNNMSISHNSTTGITNIHLFKSQSSGKVIGYIVSRTIDNINYWKNFANQQISLEENLELAKQWLAELIDGKHREKFERELPMHIHIIYSKSKKDEINGYRVIKIINYIEYSKYFTDKTISLEENLELAKQWLVELIDGQHREKQYFPKKELPTYISYSKNKKKEINGYSVSKVINNITYWKNFTNKQISLEENLELAKQWLAELIDGQHREKQYFPKKELPTYISYVRNKHDENIGYRVNKVIDNITYSKNFTDKNISLEENLELAKQWLKELLEDQHREKYEKNLPEYISYVRNKNGDNIGCEVKIKNFKRKKFTKKSLSMEEKLELAINYRDEILNSESQ